MSAQEWANGAERIAVESDPSRLHELVGRVMAQPGRLVLEVRAAVDRRTRAAVAVWHENVGAPARRTSRNPRSVFLAVGDDATGAVALTPAQAEQLGAQLVKAAKAARS